MQIPSYPNYLSFLESNDFDTIMSHVGDNEISIICNYTYPEINNSFTFSKKVETKIIAPDLVSTEEDGDHLFLLTSDEKFLIQCGEEE